LMWWEWNHILFLKMLEKNRKVEIWRVKTRLEDNDSINQLRMLPQFIHPSILLKLSFNFSCFFTYGDTLTHSCWFIAINLVKWFEPCGNSHFFRVVHFNF
jgi:hypothetical protein